VLWVFEANTEARCFYEAMGLRTDGALKMVELGKPLKAIRYTKMIVTTPGIQQNCWACLRRMTRFARRSKPLDCHAQRAGAWDESHQHFCVILNDALTEAGIKLY
jgi:hypothetical protein